MLMLMVADAASVGIGYHSRAVVRAGVVCGTCGSDGLVRKAGDAGHVFAYAFGLAAVGEVLLVVHAVDAIRIVRFQCDEKRVELFLRGAAFGHELQRLMVGVSHPSALTSTCAICLRDTTPSSGLAWRWVSPCRKTSLCWSGSL